MNGSTSQPETEVLRPGSNRQSRRRHLAMLLTLLGSPPLLHVQEQADPFYSSVSLGGNVAGDVTLRSRSNCCFSDYLVTPTRSFLTFFRSQLSCVAGIAGQLTLCAGRALDLLARQSSVGPVEFEDERLASGVKRWATRARSPRAVPTARRARALTLRRRARTYPGSGPGAPTQRIFSPGAINPMRRRFSAISPER